MEGVTMAETPTKPAEAVPPLRSQPWLHQHGTEIQAFGTVRQFPLALAYETRMYACQRLNQIHADTQILYALYKKHHWLMRGATFSQLHLLLDKHADEQLAVVDKIAERVQTLGGSRSATHDTWRRSPRCRAPQMAARRSQRCCPGYSRRTS
jgi:Ferritin-like domain